MFTIFWADGHLERGNDLEKVSKQLGRLMDIIHNRATGNVFWQYENGRVYYSYHLPSHILPTVMSF